MSNAIDVRIVPPEVDRKTIATYIVLGALSLAPVVLSILMQKPAMRQAIIMHVTHYGGELCSSQGEFWNGMAAKCKTAYNAARL